MFTHTHQKCVLFKRAITTTTTTPQQQQNRTTNWIPTPDSKCLLIWFASALTNLTCLLRLENCFCARPTQTLAFPPSKNSYGKLCLRSSILNMVESKLVPLKKRIISLHRSTKLSFIIYTVHRIDDTHWKRHFSQ